MRKVPWWIGLNDAQKDLKQYSDYFCTIDFELWCCERGFSLSSWFVSETLNERETLSLYRGMLRHAFYKKTLSSLSASCFLWLSGQGWAATTSAVHIGVCVCVCEPDALLTGAGPGAAVSHCFPWQRLAPPQGPVPQRELCYPLECFIVPQITPLERGKKQHGKYRAWIMSMSEMTAALSRNSVCRLRKRCTSSSDDLCQRIDNSSGLKLINPSS